MKRDIHLKLFGELAKETKIKMKKNLLTLKRFMTLNLKLGKRVHV